MSCLSTFIRITSLRPIVLKIMVPTCASSSRRNGAAAPPLGGTWLICEGCPTQEAGLAPRRSKFPEPRLWSGESGSGRGEAELARFFPWMQLNRWFRSCFGELTEAILMNHPSLAIGNDLPHTTCFQSQSLILLMPSYPL